MIYILSQVSGAAYRSVVKPLLFKRPPDDVHDSMIKLGRLVQKSNLIIKVTSLVWAYKNPKRLSQDIAGIHFENPVGLSAGFDQNFVLAPILKAVGFGLMEGGSLTFQQCPGNPHPWFHRLPETKSIVVYKGLANDGVSKIIDHIQSYPKDTFKSFPLNVSVARTNLPITCDDNEAITDYIGSLKLLSTYNVGSMITINISCPNTYGGEPFNSPHKLEMLLKAVDVLKLDKPVFIKMPGDLPWEKFKELLEVADRHNVTGLTIQNLAKDRSKLKLKDPLPDSIKGGLSGKPTWETSNNLIKRTRKAYGKRFVIIGVGGIFSAEDAYTKIRLGADMVELITGMIFEGPQLIGQINRGLVKLMDRDGYENISEAVGADL